MVQNHFNQILFNKTFGPMRDERTNLESLSKTPAPMAWLCQEIRRPFQWVMGANAGGAVREPQGSRGKEDRQPASAPWGILFQCKSRSKLEREGFVTYRSCRGGPLAGERDIKNWPEGGAQGHTLWPVRVRQEGFMTHVPKSSSKLLTIFRWSLLRISSLETEVKFWLCSCSILMWRTCH
jgi:hypothetical protein